MCIDGNDYQNTKEEHVMKRKMLAMIMVATMGASLLTACGSSSSDSSASEESTEETSEDTEEAADDAEDASEDTEEADADSAASGDYVYKVGFVNIDDGDVNCYPAMQNFKTYCESDEFADAVGGQVEVVTADSALDIEKQTTNVETILNMGVDMMFIIGVDTEANSTAVKECNEAGVPVFMVGTEASSGDWKFIGFDEYELGQKQGEWCIENLPENCKVCLIEGTPGREAAVLRKQGFEETIAERSDVEIISSQTGNFSVEDSMQVTEDWISAYGDEIGCIVAPDNYSIQGAVEVLKANNMTDSVITVGVSSLGPDDTESIKDGTQSCAVFCYWPSIGNLCGEIALQCYTEGYDAIEDRSNIELYSITKDNMDEVFQDVMGDAYNG